MAKFNFTLLYVSIVFALAVNANTFGSHRRDHADVGRLLKKRLPAEIASLPVPGPGQQPSAASSGNVLSVLSSLFTQVTPSMPSSTGASSSTNGGSSSSSSSNGPSSSSNTATSSSTSPATSSSPAQSSDAPQPTPVTLSDSVVVLTTGVSSAPTPTQSSTSDDSSSLSHTAVTILIIIAACIGASVIVWTIIRKWKFRPSSDFNGRMQPIDWQPGVAGGADESGLPAGHRRALSRSSSFHSGSVNSHVDHEQARGAAGAGGYGADPLNPIPDHDFTAGPANLAPVGGYADLARGASPQPMMQEPMGLAPSVHRPVQYDQYGIPPHHGYSGY